MKNMKNMNKNIKMCNLLIITFSFILHSSFNMISSDVYICKGPSSKVYHKTEHCKGLSNCSTQTYKVSEDEAKKMGRRMCRIEY